MSEDVGAVGAVAESAPQSSTEIAASVIESAEQAETSTDTPERLEVFESSEVKKVEGEPAKSEASKAAEFLRRMGHELKRSDGRRAFMPLDAVAKMLDNYLEEGNTAWTAERTSLEERAKRGDELHGFWEGFTRDFRGDERKFLEGLAEHDPRYRRFLEPPKAPEPTFADMPEGDYPLPDGSRTFSYDGIRTKLIPWLKQTVSQEAKAEALKELEAKLTARESAERQRSETSRKSQESLETQMREAQTWPMFGTFNPDGKTLTPFQQEVLAELEKDTSKRMSLRQAYLEVESRYKTTDYNTVRERVLKEVKAAPKAPAIARVPTDAPKPAGPRSSQDIARSVIAKLEAEN